MTTNYYNEEIIIRTSEIFVNDFTSYGYDDEDISTLGATEVFECVIIKDNKVSSWCRLMGNNGMEHIDSNVIIRETNIKPGSLVIKFKQCDKSEIENSINVLSNQRFKLNGYVWWYGYR